LDLVFDYSEAGLHRYAIELLNWHHEHGVVPVAVPNPMQHSAMTRYALAWLKSQTNSADVEEALRSARSQPADYFFPSRLEEMIVLEWAVEQPGIDSLAAYGLGNFLFDKRRHADAIVAWERAASATHAIPQIDRNLGIAYWNHQQDGEKAAASYARAIELSPCDARLVCEYDQLAKKRNRPAAERLAFLEARRELLLQRDDVTVELASLYNATGRAQEALELVTSRRFHPWEGGEGEVLRQYTNARLLLGQAALDQGDAVTAYDHFSRAMETPESLGEAYHPLQSRNDVNYWIGRSLRELGRNDEACEHFCQSAEEAADSSEMSVTSYGPLTFYRGLSLRALGREDEAETLFLSLLQFAKSQLGESAKIDYFATSLPNLLVFEDDLQARRDADHRLSIALAYFGLGDNSTARSILDAVLAFDQTNQHAVDLGRRLDRAESKKD
jgi:Tfp pilus assembly protein PilF